MSNNYTDAQLKQALAKMLPGVEYDTTTCKGVDLWWTESSAPVKDTELLHLCWLVEETLKHTQIGLYIDALNKAIGQNWYHHATWQQRVVALCKVKGIEII